MSTIADFFVNKKKLDQSIKTLEDKKSNLKQIVEAEVVSAFKKRVPVNEYDDMSKKHINDINKITDSLYKKYLKEVNSKIKQLYFLKSEVSNQQKPS